MIDLVEPATISPDDPNIQTQVKWLNDKELMRYSEQRHFIHTPETQFKYVASFAGSHHVFREVYCGDRLVGTVTAYIDCHNRTASAGILIAEPGRGFGRIAWTKLQELLFAQEIEKIEAGCMDANTAMKSLCLASGMTEEGRLKNHFLLSETGNRVDLVLFGLKR